MYSNFTLCCRLRSEVAFFFGKRFDLLVKGTSKQVNQFISNEKGYLEHGSRFEQYQSLILR